MQMSSRRNNPVEEQRFDSRFGWNIVREPLVGFRGHLPDKTEIKPLRPYGGARMRIAELSNFAHSARLQSLESRDIALMDRPRVSGGYENGHVE
jgi:hypothetical protein